MVLISSSKLTREIEKSNSNLCQKQQETVNGLLSLWRKTMWLYGADKKILTDFITKYKDTLTDMGTTHDGIRFGTMRTDYGCINVYRQSSNGTVIFDDKYLFSDEEHIVLDILMEKYQAEWKADKERLLAFLEFGVLL